MAYVKGFGTLLKLSISSVFTTVPQATSITPPKSEMGAVEVTHLTSSMRERIPTIIDPGDVSFNLEYDPANSVHAALLTSHLAGTIESWKIILPDSGACEIAFSGWIKQFGLGELSIDTVATIPCTIQVTGAYTITP